MLAPMSCVRTCKKMKLLCELFRFCGNQMTRETRETKIKSCAMRKEKFEEAPHLIDK